MPDLPDWQKYLPGSERYALSDLGELAVRLGSPVRYDRRGEVIWYDEFDHGLSPWLATFIGNGSSVEVSSTGTFMGPNAALLTAGEDSLRLASIAKGIHPPVLGRWGVEVAVAFLSNFDSFQIALTIYDGINVYGPSVRLSEADAEIQYRDENSAWQTVAVLGSLWVIPNTYRLLKITYDLDSAKYGILQLGPDSYDLSSFSFSSLPSTAATRIYALFQFKGRLGVNDKAQVGHVIFTANEP